MLNDQLFAESQIIGSSVWGAPGALAPGILINGQKIGDFFFMMLLQWGLKYQTWEYQTYWSA